jgi:hypothetical protein
VELKPLHQQILFVKKMGIKSRPPDIGAVYDLLHRYLVVSLFENEGGEGFVKCLLGTLYAPVGYFAAHFAPLL